MNTASHITDQNGDLSAEAPGTSDNEESELNMNNRRFNEAARSATPQSADSPQPEQQHQQELMETNERPPSSQQQQQPPPQQAIIRMPIRMQNQVRPMRPMMGQGPPGMMGP